MSRRSARLKANGYYLLDSLPSVSYHESPVRVFKKRWGRKTAPRTASLFDCLASSAIQNVEECIVTPSTSMARKTVFVIILSLLTFGVWSRLPIMTSIMSNISQKVESVTSQENIRLGQKVSEMNSQIRELQTFTESLRHRLDEQLSHTSKLEEELSSLKMAPPPAPCPETPALLTPELKVALETWLSDRVKDQPLYGSHFQPLCQNCVPLADTMANYALETQGACVVRYSETYMTVSLFGFRLWYPWESPRTVIQGNQVQPGKCWAFKGAQGTLVIALSHPIVISHVTIDHLPLYNSPTGRIDSAPRAFEVYGMSPDSEEGVLLGEFLYHQDGDATQTFKLPDQSGNVHQLVKLNILSNWGQVEYTCIYGFRVHGKIANV